MRSLLASFRYRVQTDVSRILMDLRSAPLDVDIGDSKAAIDSEIEPKSCRTPEQRQRAHIGPLPGQGKPALDKTQGPFGPVLQKSGGLCMSL